MRKITLLAVLPLLMAGVALGQETVSFSNVPSQAGSGMVTYNANLTGGYYMGALDWSGFASTLHNLTYGSELRLGISGPCGAATIQLGTGTGYAPGALFSGTYGGFNATGDPAGTWTFDFYESYDDGSDGLPDANWDWIDFTFNVGDPPPSYLWMEKFNAGGTFPPTGWSVQDYQAGGSYVLGWDYNYNIYDGTYPRGNFSSGDGGAAHVDTDALGYGNTGPYDIGLISPSFTVPTDAELHYVINLQCIGDNGFVEISTDGGSTWDIIRGYYDEDMGGFPTSPYDQDEAIGASEQYSLAAYAGMDAQLRFRYQGDGWNWWMQVDNVGVTPEPASLMLLGLGVVLLRRR